MNTLPKRKRMRLRDYDYSKNNFYFVTICSFGKKHIFGMGDNLTAYGRIAEQYINTIPDVFSCVYAEKYVIMPNHIHAIIVIDNNGLDESAARMDAAARMDEAARMYACPTLGTVIGNYKAAVTRAARQIDPGIRIWQTGYYDHIIRNQADYENTWTYIDENPLKWDSDDYY